MGIINLRYSIRALILLSTLAACVVAFTVSYGRNLLWALAHIGGTRHEAFAQSEVDPANLGEKFIQCDFLNVSFELPSTMANSITIDSKANARFLKFAAGDREIRVVLSPYSTNRAFFGTLPESIRMETATQLLQRIYAADTRDFSFNMSSENLILHEWALSYRSVFAYERHLNHMTFDDRNGIHVLTLSSDPQISPQSSKLKRLISWSAADDTDGGMIYIFDTKETTSEWSNRIAASIRMTHQAKNQQLDLAAAIDSEVIAAVNLAPITDEPSDETQSPSQSDFEK